MEARFHFFPHPSLGVDLSPTTHKQRSSYTKNHTISSTSTAVPIDTSDIYKIAGLRTQRTRGSPVLRCIGHGCFHNSTRAGVSAHTIPCTATFHTRVSQRPHHPLRDLHEPWRCLPSGRLWCSHIHEASTTRQRKCQRVKPGS